MSYKLRFLVSLVCLMWMFAVNVSADPYPPVWGSGAVEFQPVNWPTNTEWKPYSRFGNGINDPRTNDPSNGGTRPQNYVNIASSCTDKAEPSVYYYLHQDGSDPAKDVIMFRWRVEQVANTYATGPRAGAYSSGDVWNSALWTVLFDVDGDGIRDIAAHLDGSSGSPDKPIDMIFGIYGNIPTQSVDYNEPGIHLLAHNPTAFVDGSTVLNFQSSLAPTTDWSSVIALPDEQKVWDYGTTRSSYNQESPCNEYYIDYQIPIAMLDATSLGGPGVTRDTPLSMMFCTANSLNNPFQKDCALNRTWTADPLKPAPFGDFISFNEDDPYEQPIVDDITSSGCSPVILTAKVKDAIAIDDSGAAVPTVDTVAFYYYRDTDGDGIANDGETWTHAVDATRVDFINWTANWNSSALFKGQYLIGVQTTDNPLLVDDDMPTDGNTNRTFSYLSQAQVDALAGQPADENWLANPDITGVKSIALAVNICGVAPTISKSASPDSVATGDDVTFTIVISNDTGSALNMTEISDSLPDGFSYQSTTSITNDGSNIVPGSPVNGATGVVAWTFNETVAVGSNIILEFVAQASSIAGTYNNISSSKTVEFGEITSTPVQIQVDSARISLSKTPDKYLVNPGGTVAYTLNYANNSSVSVSNAFIIDTLPADVTCNDYSVNGAAAQSCSGQSATITLGNLAAFESGIVTLNVTVGNGYASSSLINEAELSVTAPDASTVTANADSTIAVNIPIPAFTLSKNTSTPSINPGDSISWTITYENYGTDDAGATVITDTLPEGFIYSSCTGGISCTEIAGVVTWTLGDVAPGTSGSVTVTASAGTSLISFLFPNPALNMANIKWSQNSTGITASNEVGISGKSCSEMFYFHEDLTANSTYPMGNGAFTVLNGSSVSFTTSLMTSETIIDGKELAVRLYLDPTTGNADMTIKVSKVAGSTPTLITTTNFPMGNSPAWYDVVFAIPGGEAPLAIGEKLEFELTYDNNSKDLTIYYDGDTGTGIFADSQASICLALSPANLTISKTVDKANIISLPADLQYTIDFANIGGLDANAVLINDILPPDVTCSSYSFNGIDFFQPCPAPLLFNVGTLTARYSSSIIINAEATPGASGTLTNTATIDSADTILVQDTAETLVGSLSGGGTPQLKIEKSVDKSYIIAADIVTYTLKVINAGTGTAENISVADTIHADTYFSYVDNSISGGTTQNVSGSDLTWSIAALDVGQAAILSFQMKAATTGIPPGITELDNTAVISDAEYCTLPSVSGCTSNTSTITLSGNPNLTIVKSASNTAPATGETITYTLLVTNNGSSSATGVVVNDVIPDNMSFAGNITATTGSGSFDTLNNAIIFNVADLVAGSSATLTFDVQVSSVLNAGTTDIINTALASASNAQQSSSSVTVASTADIDLIVNISGPTSASLPSSFVAQDMTASTILIVDDASQFTTGQEIRVGSNYAIVTAINGSVLTLDTAVSAINGDEIIGSVSYAVYYENQANADASNADLVVTLPPGINYYSASTAPDAAPVQGSDGNVSWDLNTVAAGASGSFQIVAFPSASGSYTLTAVVSSDDAIDNAETNNRDTQVTIFGGLKVDKSTSTPVITQPANGVTEDVNYTITVTNTLAVNVTEVAITDMLPAGFSFGSTNRVIGSSYTDAAAPSSQPVWKDLTIPAGGIVTIDFTVQITDTVGAATYQNGVQVTTVTAGVAITQFDELSSPAEDVTVLNPNDGIVNGYIFEDRDGNDNIDSGDIPFEGINVRITSAANSSKYYITATDGNGYFSRVLTSGDWIVDLDETQVDNTLTLSENHSDSTTVSVPAGSSATDLNAYSLPGGQIIPTLSIDDISVNENAGTAIFTITASAASDSDITFSYTTSNGTAIVGNDYNSISGTGTIRAGNTTTTIDVPIIDDTVKEPVEYFNIDLSNSSGAVFTDSTGIGTIVDNENDTDNDGKMDFEEYDNDGDGIPDDHDNDGIADYLDYDPMGYFYDVDSGTIITGGNVDVACNPAQSIVYDKDGSDGQYQWHINSLAEVTTCDMVFTIPAGYILDSTCPASAGTLDPTGENDPYIIGSSRNGVTNRLVDSSCSANTWYTGFILEPGDPSIFNNNVPIKQIAILAVPTEIPVLNLYGLILLILSLTGIVRYGNRVKKCS